MAHEGPTPHVMFNLAAPEDGRTPGTGGRANQSGRGLGGTRKQESFGGKQPFV